MAPTEFEFSLLMPRPVKITTGSSGMTGVGFLGAGVIVRNSKGHQYMTS
jgi:hypothetical protein